MAARDNQGLQIAVILMVMMVVGLGITTGVFYNANLKAQTDAKDANTRAQSESSKSREYLLERNRLKVMIGHTDETTMEEIETQFANDVASFVADENGTPADVQAVNYRKIPVELRNKYATLEQQLATRTAEVNTLTAERDSIRATTTAAIDKAKAEKDAAEAKLQKLTADYQAERQSLQDDQKKVLASKQGIEGQVAQVTAKFAADKKVMEKQIKDLEILVAGLNKVKQDLEPQITDRPDGKIVWSNQREQTVWINLGSQDLLRPQMTFSVFPVGQENLAGAKSKGSIEVTKIHDGHQAEARITSFDVSNPIMPGDTIFTATWTPGHPEKFAIVGYIDIDGDDKDDTDDLRQIIETSGGVVAAYVDDTGSIKGAITPDIRYLILGKRPTDKTSEGSLTSYSQMSEAARGNGIQAIRVDQFLDWAGYVGAEELVRLNAASKLEELEAAAEKEKAGFQKRRPAGNSAF
ncbi:hypothetical protein C5Y96_00880 [Blastopirellula marina]|uniref:BRCT domain-containing protein n=1 Tax=Blastopirellula marina TaxID=124 RepID=A0A2S8GA42_9BACT|nr:MULTISPECIES: hypothetical protein [Pirellulaceae]PQO41297.1 hypothetical protein C5Y96_00880 [Blastopirellula marina]RCS56321.1 hypothetical protein DTL36_00880 [Bremerella cremea]